MSPRVPVLLSVAALSLFSAACGEDETEPAAADSTMEQPMQEATPEPMADASQTIVGVAQGERRLSTLVQAVTAADLGMTLQG